MPKASSRPLFPSSCTDFALPPSSVASTSALTLDDPNVLLQRFRRPSLLAPKNGYVSESRLHSPLASSFTLHSRRRSHGTMAEESESDKEKVPADNSPESSGNSTPHLKIPEKRDEQVIDKTTIKRPSTPPRRTSSTSMDVETQCSPKSNRRLSFPPRQLRVMSLLAESKPEENEVRSEAAFQRLISSSTSFPSQPRTPRVAADRGRYPEEAGQEDEPQREDTPSDDEDEAEDTPFAFSASGGSQPISIQKPHTPGGSLNGDDPYMSISESSSFGTLAMDVDLPPGSPITISAHWRYTPPPTTSAVRSNKRKLDDRFDPYPSAKRRAVSPSISSYLRDSQTAVGSPMSARNNRLPIAIPINIPGSAVSSATSSPTIGGSYSGSFSRSVSITSSPTLRPAVILGSPILRPVPRAALGIRRGEGDDREIEGAGEAVGGLTLTE